MNEKYERRVYGFYTYYDNVLRTGKCVTVELYQMMIHNDLLSSLMYLFNIYCNKEIIYSTIVLNS